jgi:hypothetical protein
MGWFHYDFFDKKTISDLSAVKGDLSSLKAELNNFKGKLLTKELFLGPDVTFLAYDEKVLKK